MKYELFNLLNSQSNQNWLFDPSRLNKNETKKKLTTHKLAPKKKFEKWYPAIILNSCISNKTIVLNSFTTLIKDNNFVVVVFFLQ